MDTAQNSTQQGKIRLYHANCILLADTDKHKHVSSASSSSSSSSEKESKRVRLCLFVCVGLSIYEFISSYGTHTHTGLAVSLMISHTAQLTPLDSRLSPIMHHISSPGSELIKVVGKRGRWDERRRGGGRE